MLEATNKATRKAVEMQRMTKTRLPCTDYFPTIQTQNGRGRRKPVISKLNNIKPHIRE